MHSGRKEAPRFWAKEERHLSAQHTQVAGISFSMELGGYGGCFNIYIIINIWIIWLNMAPSGSCEGRGPRLKKCDNRPVVVLSSIRKHLFPL